MKTIHLGTREKGKAWTICFLYSKTGNFVLKGDSDKIRDYIQENHPRSFYRMTYWKDGEHRGRWSSPCLNIKRGYYKHELKGRTSWMGQPVYILHYDKKFTITTYNAKATIGKHYGIEEIKLKRIPNKWIPEFDTLLDTPS